MSNEMAKVIIKVGNSSKIMLRNVKAYRAITFKDISNLLLSNSDIKSVIIEDINENEMDKAKEVLENLKLAGINTFIQNENESETICGIANTYGIKIYSDLSSLQEELSEKLGINVSTKWKHKDITEDEKYIENYNEELTEALRALGENVIPEEILHPSIENKEDLFNDNFDFNTGQLLTDNEIEVINEYKEKNYDEINALLENTRKDKINLDIQLTNAMERIQTLLDVKESLEDERDIYKKMITDVESDSEIMEDPVSSDKYNSIKIELDSYIDKYKKSEQTINDIKDSIEIKDTQIDELMEHINQNNTEIDKLNEQIEEVTSNMSQDEAQKIPMLEIEIISMKTLIEQYRDKLSLEINNRIRVAGLLAYSIDIGKKTNEELKEKILEIKNAHASIQNLEYIKGDSEIEIQQLKNKTIELDKLMSDIENKSDKEKQEVQDKIDKSNIKISTLENELKNTKDGLKNKEMELRTIVETNGIDAGGVSNLVNINNVMGEANKTLTKNMSYLSNELENTRNKLHIAEKAYTTVDETNKKLKASINVMSRGGITGASKITIPCDYTGKALIIPVFGSGSYGITTTAVSIARKIANGRVLYMDMDISNPKADGMFGINPIIKELTDITQGLKKTGLGALIDKGVDYVITNEKAIFQRATQLKTTTIDYFSGIYAQVDTSSILTINFTEFMTYIGNKYSHIVVDLGRLGSSDIGNALIKMFNGISHKNVIVSLNNAFDARTMGLKASMNEIKLDNTIWVLNISDNTIVDNITQKSVGSAKTIIVPKNMQMYGSSETYDKVSGTKDKLSQLVELLQI